MHSYEDQVIISKAMDAVKKRKRRKRFPAYYYENEISKLKEKFADLDKKFERLKNRVSNFTKLDYLLETQLRVKKNINLKIEVKNKEGKTRQYQEIIKRLEEDLETFLYVFKLAEVSYNRDLDNNICFNLNSKNSEQNYIHYPFWNNYRKQEKSEKDIQPGIINVLPQ